MARLAADAHKVIEALGLSDVTLVAHSMGCGVAFAYWDIYRDDRLKRLVLIDEPTVLVSQPDWPEGMAAQEGAPHTAEGLPAFTAALRGQQAPAVAAGALDAMVTARMPGGRTGGGPAADAAHGAGGGEPAGVLQRDAGLA
jgi:non-heme chloroperoxidase